jgi:hypothetical protein
MKTITTALCALLLLPLISLADDDEHGEREGRSGGEHSYRAVPPAQVNATWQKECSGCHIAYPPGFLPAASWQKVMDGLDKHFGSDATLTPAEKQEVTTFLVKFASSGWSGAAAPLRITETSGFRRKHEGDEVPAGVWKRASVKSAANCLACHTAADKGDFSEGSVRIPK